MSQTVWRRFAAVVLMCAIGLGGCGRLAGVTTTCSSDNSTSVTRNLITNTVEKAAIADAKRDDGTYAVSESSIRAAIALLKVSIDDIRTTKEDPNSTKKFCTGTAKVVFPINAIDDADKARALQNQNTVSALADASNVQRNADAFTFSIDYDVQPTDDGKSIFSESDSLTAQTDFLAQVVVSYLLKAQLENQQAQQQQAQQQQAEQEQAAQDQANQADLAQAQADDKLSEQTINAAWQSIDPDTRTQLVADERAWIAAKTANCNVQAAGTSTDPTQREVARLKCDAAANQARLGWMRQYLPQQ